MKSYSSYKDSGVKWIGEIPSHWTKSRLKYVSEIVTGNTPPTKDKDNYEGGEYLWVKPNEINELNPTNDTNQKLTEKGKSLSRVLPPFSVLVNGIGRIGEFGYSELPVSTNQQINSIVYKNRVDNRFGIYHVSMMKEGFLSNSEKVVVPILNKSKQENIEFIQPPISEQTQIVSFLDTKTQKIDELIEKTEQKIKLLKDKRLKLVEDVILNPKTEKVRLEFVVDLIKRPIGREDNKTYNKIGMYNWGRGIFKYPSELGSELGDSKFNFIKEGDLLLSGQFSWEGSVSMVEKEVDDCISSHRFHILMGKKDIILNEYLWSYFTSQEGHFLLTENSFGSSGRNQPLNIGRLLKEKIPIPDLSIQKEIKKFVEQTRKFEKYSEKRIKLLKEYRQSLISQVVTGKVDVRG